MPSAKSAAASSAFNQKFPHLADLGAKTPEAKQARDWLSNGLKEALLAYHGLLAASAPLAPEALKARVEDLLTKRFGVSADFAVDAALAPLKELGLVSETGGLFSALPLPDALSRLDREWQAFFAMQGGEPQGRR